VSIPAKTFPERYAEALTDFLSLSDEANLEHAYELGREAISLGLGVLDLAAVHSLSLGTHGASPSSAPNAPAVGVSQQTWQFFAEALAPFEMALRGFRETNAALKSMATTLEDRVVARTEELRVAERALREQARVLRSVVDSISDGIVVADTAGKFQLFNDAGQRLLGVGATDTPPEDWAATYAVFQPDTVTPFQAEELPLVRAIKGEQTGAVPMFIRNKRMPEGVHLSVIGSPLRREDGVVEGGVVVFRDITEAKRTEERLSQVQKMEAVGRLAGGIAHDFNNILSVILSYTEILGMGLKEDEPIHADIEEIGKAAQRAADLTRQLLAFSRQQVLEEKVLDLNESIAGMDKMLRRLLGADVELSVLPAVGLWSAKADPSQIEQILMNLAVNARDAMPVGGKLTIETENVELDNDYASAHQGVAPGSYVRLAVSDTGIGMSREMQARIFEPFFTTKERGKGTGLGLATVFGIVKQSGGNIWVYSELGKGTTFKIHLPKVSGSPETSATLRPQLPPERGNETILLVEDDEQLRVLARDILRRNGHVVLEAANGGEALLACEQHAAKIHLLLTDVVLPRMSGRQLADRLVTQRPEMKVLFMSGYTDDAVLQHGILESGVAFLQKPLTRTSLLKKVREVLAGENGRYRANTT
jgi:two-component system, cell cycle sensor histidine kinase and response regulator CckA